MDVGVDPNDANTGNMEPLTSNVDTNGNDNETDNDNNIEDNINEAASEDSGMSSVDNHNMSGRKMSEKCLFTLSCILYCQHTTQIWAASICTQNVGSYFFTAHDFFITTFVFCQPKSFL